MKRSQAFPSKYLSKDDINGTMTATIRAVVAETVQSDGEDQNRPVMYFLEQNVKPFIVNNTNWMAIEDVYGDESDHWVSKTIELYVDPSVMFGGKRVGGVRVRIPAPTENPTAPNTDAPAMTWDDAVANCFDAGIAMDDLKLHLKAAGLAQWNDQARESVRQLVDATLAAKKTEQASQPAEDDEIPW